jgi:hypothetical protein
MKKALSAFAVLSLLAVSNVAHAGAACSADYDQVLSQPWTSKTNPNVQTNFNFSACTVAISNPPAGYSSNGAYFLKTAFKENGAPTKKIGNFELSIRGATNYQGIPNGYYYCSASQDETAINEERTKTETKEVKTKDPKTGAVTTTTVEETTKYMEQVGSHFEMKIYCNKGAVSEVWERDEYTNGGSVAAN